MTASDLGFFAAIAVRTAIVLAVLVAGIRLTGKRQAGELNLHDLLLVLILANAVQNAMTRSDGRLPVALISAGTLILLGLLYAAVQSRWPGSEKWVVGVPTVLAEDGRMNRRHMRQEGVTEDELRAAVHDQGLADLREVRLAVLETDGSISVISREEESSG